MGTLSLLRLQVVREGGRGGRGERGREVKRGGEDGGREGAGRRGDRGGRGLERERWMMEGGRREGDEERKFVFSLLCFIIFLLFLPFSPSHPLSPHSFAPIIPPSPLSLTPSFPHTLHPFPLFLSPSLPFFTSSRRPLLNRYPLPLSVFSQDLPFSSLSNSVWLRWRAAHTYSDPSRELHRLCCAAGGCCYCRPSLRGPPHSASCCPLEMVCVCVCV